MKPSSPNQSSFLETSGMTELRVMLPRNDWLFFAVGYFSALFIVLQPKWQEFAYMMAIDFLASMVLIPLNEIFFARAHPEAKYFVGSIDWEFFSSLKGEDRKNFFRIFSEFPKQRAVAFILGSFAKGVPAFVFMCLFWTSSRSPLDQLALILMITLVVYFYAGTASFINSHLFLSGLIKDIHEKFDWSDVFESIQLGDRRKDFEFYERLSFFVILGFFTLLLGSIIWNHESENTHTLTFQIVFVSILAFSLLARLMSLTRRFLLGGIAELFEIIKRLDYRQMQKSIPLHTHELLAKFEQSFNQLIHRLKKSEQELANWVIVESEKSRFNTLGEMSALVAHDLKGPFSVIRFCIEEIREKPELLAAPEYLEQLETNLSHAEDLVLSLQARFREDANDFAHFMDAFRKVTRILSTQFRGHGFGKIKFEVDSKLEFERVRMQSVHLIHILENILRNSVSHLLENKILNPQIRVHVGYKDDRMLNIEICDNGLGLKPKQFEELTSFAFSATGAPTFANLGLKLTRRLLESIGGSVGVVESDHGAIIQLSLPRGE